jgi:hypothetical protein
MLAVTGCSSSSGIPAAQFRAQQICVSFVPASVSTTLGTPVAAELTRVGWTTAGQIKAPARERARSPVVVRDQVVIVRPLSGASR